MMIDVHLDQGYEEVSVPYVVHRDSMIGTGQLPKMEYDMYRTDPDDLFLIPTAEVPVTNLLRDTFIDPDLLPVHITLKRIEEIRAQLPELPDAKRDRFCAEFELSSYDADVLTAQRALADYFEAVVGQTAATPKLAANWLITKGDSSVRAISSIGSINDAGTAAGSFASVD